MKLIAVIIDPMVGQPYRPAQVLKILMHLLNTQRPPPGLDPACLP